MEHVVFSAAVDGAGEEFRRVASLEEAVRVVEHLRNDLGIEDASVFSLTAVPLAFRTYYRVEVPGIEAAEAAAVPLLAVPSLASDPEPQPPLALVSDGSAAGADDEEGLVAIPSLEPVPSIESLESMAELADMATADEFTAPLPAMPGPGLQPRLSEPFDSRVEGPSEHSLGYFTR